VAALGATLFPVTSLAEGLRQDLSPTSHILIRLRFYHPLIAALVGAWLFFAANFARVQRPGIWTKRFAGALMVLVVIQLVAGVANLLLHAPIWLQIAHLLLSDLIWLALILLTATSFAQQPHKEAVTAVEIAATA